MDEFSEGFTVKALTIIENIDIKTIHLLSESDKYIIAVSWLECNEAHFKMFKNQDLSNIKTLCDFLLDYDQRWYNLILNWKNNKLSIPLSIKSDKL